MKLRTRIILVLLPLLIVPLGTVTLYSYLTNVATLEEAAAREADLLAGELSARMQLITAELSDRVGRLMDVQAKAEATPAVVKAPVKAVAAAPEPAPVPAADAPGMETQVASALGEAAMLLNSVELQGARGFGRGGRSPATSANGGTTQGSTGGDRGAFPPDVSGGRGGRGQRGNQGPRMQPPASDAAAPPSSGGTLPAPPSIGTASPTAPIPPADPRIVPLSPIAPSRSKRPNQGKSTGGAGAAATQAASTVAPPAPGAAATVGMIPVPGLPKALDADANRIVIDMGAISRDIVKKMVPDGSMANMTPEERQRLSREMGMRMMGITEGIKIGAAELQKKADLAKQRAAEDVKAADASRANDARGPTQTKTALQGNKLGVTQSRNGKVVQAVSAEINLDQVLMTVFSTTRRDRGEVPFAIAKDGKIYTAVASDRAIVQSFGPAIRPDGPLGRTTLPDWIVVTTKDPSGSGLRFGIARPVGDSLSDLRRRASRNAGLGLALIALALVGVVPISARLTRNLTKLTDGVESIARGDYTARVNVKSHDEIGILAAAFNQMAADVQEHQKSLLSQERLKRELELGRQIQNEMLPHEPLRIGLMEVKGESVPAREVGGDFFNYFTLSSGEVALLLGDVSGKGVGAALVMANIQATLRTRLAIEQDLTVITDAIDRELEASTRAAYATLIVGIYNPITKRIRFVNAGHNPQFVLRADGSLDQMSSTGTPVGLLSGRGYQQGTLQLASGDFIFFYTDGLVEAENDLGEFFGSERLEAVLLEAHKQSHGSIDYVFSTVKTAIDEFSGDREPFDDATMMAVRIG